MKIKKNKPIFKVNGHIKLACQENLEYLVV